MTSPTPVPRSPPIPAIGVSLRFTQELPTRRTRESANGSACSDPPPGAGATTVIRSDCTCLRLGGGGPDLERVGAERDAVQAPSGARLHAPIAHEVACVPDREDVAYEALRSSDASGRVEHEVAVLILRIDRVVVPAAARPDVAEGVRHHLPVVGGRAERQRVDHDAAG